MARPAGLPATRIPSRRDHPRRQELVIKATPQEALFKIAEFIQEHRGEKPLVILDTLDTTFIDGVPTGHGTSTARGHLAMTGKHATTLATKIIAAMPRERSG